MKRALYAVPLAAALCYAAYRLATHRRMKRMVSDTVIDWLGARC